MDFLKHYLDESGFPRVNGMFPVGFSGFRWAFHGFCERFFLSNHTESNWGVVIGRRAVTRTVFFLFASKWCVRTRSPFLFGLASSSSSSTCSSSSFLFSCAGYVSRCTFQTPYHWFLIAEEFHALNCCSYRIADGFFLFCDTVFSMISLFWFDTWPICNPID